jgi:hypothetical protein
MVPLRTLLLFGLFLFVAAGAWLHPEWFRTQDEPAAAPPLPRRLAVRTSPPPAVPTPRTTDLGETRPPLPPPAPEGSTPLTEADRQIYAGLALRVNAGAVLVPDDIDAAASLRARYPDEGAVEQLLLEALLAGAAAEHRARRDVQALAYLRRAYEQAPAEARARQALLKLLLAMGDWSALESTAQDLVASDPGDAEAWYALGYALFRQDRNREARNALESCLGIREHRQARELWNRLQKNLADETGMTEQQVAHFHVRYDGESHDDVGREILRALERHYVTLVSAFDHQPQATIPVILFSRELYYDASGAPAWSGGAFDNIDGRIRVPIGGLTQNLSRDMEQTLIHELTHAFVNDKTKGMAPRDLHEGLAQYMEGDRIASRLDRNQLAALAAGRLGGVGGFYLGALAFVEYLIDRRGMGGINELLTALATTGSLDDAFRQVHGQGYADTRRAWQIRMLQQYGS